MARRLRRKGWPVRFGDAEDTEFPATLPLANAAWAVSTLPESSVNAALPDVLRAHGFTGKMAIALRGDTDATAFAKRRVDHVFRPYDDAADFAAREIGQSLARQKRFGLQPAPVE